MAGVKAQRVVKKTGPAEGHDVKGQPSRRFPQKAQLDPCSTPIGAAWASSLHVAKDRCDMESTWTLGLDKPCYDVHEIVSRRIIPAGRTKVLELIKSKRLAARWDGRGWIVTAPAIVAYLESLPSEAPESYLGAKEEIAGKARAGKVAKKAAAAAEVLAGKAA